MVFWISIMLAGIFLFLALRGLDWDGFILSIRNADYRYIFIALIMGSLTSWIRASRWRVLLCAEKVITVRNVFWANMAGYLGNNLLPARAGELIRAAYVSQENGLSFSFSLATGLVERFVDLIALVLLGMFSLSSAQILSPPLQNALGAASIIAMLGTAAVLILPYLGSKISQLIQSFPTIEPRVKAKLVGSFQQFLRGIEALHHPQRIIGFISLTFLIWLMDATGVVLVARALHMDFTLSQSFLLLAALGLSSAIPSTPGYVGVYQFVAVLILAPFGVSNENAIALILVIQITGLMLVMVFGGIAMLHLSQILNKPALH